MGGKKSEKKKEGMAEDLTPGRMPVPNPSFMVAIEQCDSLACNVQHSTEAPGFYDGRMTYTMLRMIHMYESLRRIMSDTLSDAVSKAYIEHIKDMESALTMGWTFSRYYLDFCDRLRESKSCPNAETIMSGGGDAGQKREKRRNFGKHDALKWSSSPQIMKNLC